MVGRFMLTFLGLTGTRMLRLGKDGMIIIKESKGVSGHPRKSDDEAYKKGFPLKLDGIFNSRHLSRSFADVLKTGGFAHSFPAKEAVPEVHLIFNSSKEELSRFKKAFIGEVENPRLTYSLQNIFHPEGYFS